MANRMKEDEKNERIIRGLLKMPENRRCVNCNSLGPQYVCTNFWTFVCTTCSGIHREFTHRVKSVSMAKFTSQEVNALQGGGNERARGFFFKEWDPQRHSLPDSSNVERLRDFIRHVYVDRRYTGERSIDKPPTVKMGDRDDSYESRRVDTYRGPGSPPYEDTYGRRYGERSGPGRRINDRKFRYSYDEKSPGYDQENQRYAYRKSPVRFEVVDDRFRDDRFRNGRRSEDSRSLDGESKLDGRSPDCQKDMDISGPPMVRPVRDILGENVPPLRVGEPPKASGGRTVDGPVYAQRTASSSSLGSVEGNSVELKMEDSGSLIDFNADPEPSNAAAVPQTQQIPAPMGPSVTQPTSSAIDVGNWASFDFSSQEKISQVPSDANNLETILSQLSVPAAVPANNISAISSSGVPAAPGGHMSMLPISGVATPSAPATDVSTLPPSDGAPAAIPGATMPILPSSGDLEQWPNTQQHQRSLFPPTNITSAQHFSPSAGGASNNQPWSTPFRTDALGHLSTATLQSSQAISKPIENTRSGVVSQPAEAKNSGRKELPVDLFAATYSSIPAAVPRWQAAPPHSMGFNMQYPTALPMPAFPHLSKSANPFDLNNEPVLVPTPTFPSMASLQGALPNISAPTSLLRTSSVGTPSPQQMLPQFPFYVSGMPSQSPSPAMSPSAYMGQQIPGNLPPYGHQGLGGISSKGGAVFETSNTNQPHAGRLSAPATPNSFSSFGTNPFG